MSRRVPGHDALLARGRRLQFATIAWNVLEVAVTVTLGVIAGSLALIAFGLDSLVEVFASVVVLWYIAEHHEPNRARHALRLVAVAFGAVAVYLAIATLAGLVRGANPESSPAGIVYLAMTACVMFGLANAKHAIARAAASEPLGAEARMTFLDGCLASGVLVALVLNALWGLWWADTAAAGLVAAFCAREALDNWRTAPNAPTLDPNTN